MGHDDLELLPLIEPVTSIQTEHLRLCSDKSLPLSWAVLDVAVPTDDDPAGSGNLWYPANILVACLHGTRWPLEAVRAPSARVTGVGHSEFVSKVLDEGPKALHRRAKGASVLPKVASLDELAPGHGVRAGSRRPQDRRVGPPPPLATLQLVVEGCARDAEHLSSDGLVVQFAVKNGRCHAHHGGVQVVKWANTKLDECRRRVQNETMGRRGNKSDPLYRCRKLLVKADERLDEQGRDKLLGLACR